jgi:hypothetical protein
VDIAHIDQALDSRAATFENLTAARGAGGTTAGGRKGSPSRRLAAGERVTLADVAGPGVGRHLWMTFPPAPPEVMRSLWLEVFYDGASAPSISVPALDFFGLPLGRPVPFASAFATAQEGRGFNSYLPMPFASRLRVDLENGSDRALDVYYQLDFTLQQVPDDHGYLHVSFRRENPTTMTRDFVIEDGLEGPGRFAGCNVGIRVLDEGFWYGEGEVKIFIDGDGALPTICGTGLEDYAGSAWGMGAHAAPYSGSPLEVRAKGQPQPAFVGFYRWHAPDPVVFRHDLRVTIQQIGMHLFADDQADAFDAYAATHPAAGRGWDMQPRPGIHAMGICERVDDYCATAFTYCLRPQAVPRLDLAAAVADIARLDWEPALPLERMFG